MLGYIYIYIYIFYNKNINVTNNVIYGTLRSLINFLYYEKLFILIFRRAYAIFVG